MTPSAGSSSSPRCAARWVRCARWRGRRRWRRSCSPRAWSPESSWRWRQPSDPATRSGPVGPHLRVVQRLPLTSTAAPIAAGGIAFGAGGPWILGADPCRLIRTDRFGSRVLSRIPVPAVEDTGGFGAGPSGLAVAGGAVWVAA